MPNAVGKNSRGQGIGRVCNPFGKLQTSTLRGIDLQVGEIKHLRKAAGNHLSKGGYVPANMDFGVLGLTVPCTHSQGSRLLF